MIGKSTFSQSYIEVEDLEFRLVEELKNTGFEDYVSFKIDMNIQTTNWGTGILWASHTDETVGDPHEFLLKKQNSEIVDFAFIYTPKFDQWLDDPTFDVYNAEVKRFKYSSLNVSKLAKDQIVQSEDTPNFSFPWRQNESNYPDLWKLNAGPHSALGPNHQNDTFSGLDFGETATITNVLSVDEGLVFATSEDCEVFIQHPGGWETRYLHVDNIQVRPTEDNYPGDFVTRGQWIADVDMDWPICYNPTGTHLHLDFRKDRKYVSANGKYIGGWEVVSTGLEYEGYLQRGHVRIPKGGFIYNLGYIGQGGVSELKQEFINGITLCSKDRCNVVSLDNIVSPSQIAGMKFLLAWAGLSVHFYMRPEKSTGLASAVNFACIDFDTEELYRYNFPGTTLNLLQNATEARVMLGDCDPATRPIKDDGFATGGFNEGLVTSSCGNIPFFAVIDDDGTCYVPPPGLPLAPVTLPFNPVKVKFWRAEDSSLSLFDRQGNCTVVGDGSRTEYDVSGDFYRLVFGPCDFSFGRNDLPVIYGKFASKHIEPPVITWQISDQDLNKAIRSRIKFYKVPSSGQKVLLKDLTLSRGIYQWKPDIYEKGKYELTVEVVDGSFQPTNESIARYSYEIVNGPDWYIGWDQLQKDEAGSISKVKNFVVAAGQVLDVWGSVVKINGGLQRRQSIIQANANTVYRLGAGNYNIEWAEGTVYVGLDSGAGHHLWEAQKNYAVTGTSWQAIDLRDPSELPTLTPTPTPSATPTPVDTTTPTATAMTTVTSTPVIEVTQTPTLVPNPIASSTPTLTLTPSTTPITPTLTPTATETVTVPHEDCPCIVLLPLIQHP